jgi:WD40 repeat protein
MGNFAGSRRPDTRLVPQEPLLEPLQPLICCRKLKYWTYALAIIPWPDGAAPRIVTGPYENGNDGNNPINVWDSDTGALTHSITGHEACVSVLVAYELAPGQDHVRLASAHGREAGGMLILWAVDEDFRQLATVQAHRGGVTSLLFLDSGSLGNGERPRLVSGGSDATVKVRENARREMHPRSVAGRISHFLSQTTSSARFP